MYLSSIQFVTLFISFAMVQMKIRATSAPDSGYLITRKVEGSLPYSNLRIFFLENLVCTSTSNQEEVKLTSCYS